MPPMEMQTHTVDWGMMPLSIPREGTVVEQQSASWAMAEKRAQPGHGPSTCAPVRLARAGVRVRVRVPAIAESPETVVRAFARPRRCSTACSAGCRLQAASIRGPSVLGSSHAECGLFLFSRFPDVWQRLRAMQAPAVMAVLSAEVAAAAGAECRA